MHGSFEIFLIMNMMYLRSIDVPYTYGSYHLDQKIGPMTDGEYLYFACRYIDSSAAPEEYSKLVLYVVIYEEYSLTYSILDTEEFFVGDSTSSLSDIIMHNSYILVSIQETTIGTDSYSIRTFTFNGTSLTSVTTKDLTYDADRMLSNGSNVFTYSGTDRYLRRWTYSGGAFSLQYSLLTDYAADDICVVPNGVVWITNGWSLVPISYLSVCSLILTNQNTSSFSGYCVGVAQFNNSNYILHHQSIYSSFHTTSKTLYIKSVSSSQSISLVDSISLDYIDNGLQLESGRSIITDGINIITPVGLAETSSLGSGVTYTFKIFDFDGSNLNYQNKTLINELPNFQSDLSRSCRIRNLVFSDFSSISDITHRIDVFSYGQGYPGAHSKFIWVPGV